ncbi:chloramphenicol acetyltransferase [Flavobacterium franklandianum]|uniref:Chloramphenicol acetyltransferase n=1 Tax=Flavobacterium franklandianum TaxID=2594430 RepID=A0A553CT33_9FLAO|nr:chloramphenicol acetyltransferase [Flavobacterium franklandianum]TRX23631.1 chloramphenicol acetyltransferase [Flavobacterium franklandianum]TRX29917.1 chloramphenicol acetyltransferase [Flavobacterium franklandianum]
MKTLLDLENWPRKEHFLFFKQFEEPFFGLTVEIDCTKAYATAKQLRTSFFVYYLHKTIVAVNTIESFRYRIVDDSIYIYDSIDVSATIMREDQTFGFSLIEYSPDFEVFSANTFKEIERIQNTSGLLTREFPNDNLIHFSAIPWVNFTSLSHARSYTFPDSCPKISFGKMTIGTDGKRTMSISIHAHHGLMDGFHVSQFLNCFQELMNQ